MDGGEELPDYEAESESTTNKEEVPPQTKEDQKRVEEARRDEEHEKLKNKECSNDQ